MKRHQKNWREGQRTSARRGRVETGRGSGAGDAARSLFERLEGRTLMAATVIAQDFTSGAAGFTPAGGTWAASAGAYQVSAADTTATSHLNTRSLHDAVVTGDFTLSADASVAGTTSAWNDLAVIFGYQDANNYYFFSSNESNDGQTSGLFKVVNGTSTQLADVAAPITAGTTYGLRVERVGDQVNAYRNGQLVAGAADSAFLSGRVGFGSKSDRAVFDNLLVTQEQPPQEEPPLVEEDFSTGAGGFAADSGTWAASGGAFRATTPGTAAVTHLNTRAVHSSVIDGDFSLSADASVVGTAGAWNDFAVVFGYQDANNYYFFSSNESNDVNTSGLFKVVNGTTTELADVAAGIGAGTTYALRVDRAGGQISAYRDGQLVASASDVTFASGRVGFGSKSDAAVFDNLVVTGDAVATPPPAPTVPAAPTGLTAAAASDTRVDLNWVDNSIDESGFRIERSANGGATWVASGTAAAGVRTYAVTGLAPSTQYQFRVRAYNAAGDSASSNVSSATTFAAPQVGVRPGATNTGPTNPTALRASGTIVVTQNGAVIENVDVTGTIEIRASNVTLRNFRIRATGPYGIRATYGGTGNLIEDGEITGMTSAGVYGSGFTARRLNVHHSGSDAMKPGSNVVIESCWFHHLGSVADSHADGVQMVAGTNVTIRGNNFDMRHDEPGFNNTQCIIIQSDIGRVDNITIQDNWINGGGYSVQIRDKGTGYGVPTNVRITGNRFGRQYQFGTHVVDRGAGLVWSNNVWDDTGALISL